MLEEVVKYQQYKCKFCGHHAPKLEDIPGCCEHDAELVELEFPDAG
jgi:hypothetical protein